MVSKVSGFETLYAEGDVNDNSQLSKYLSDTKDFLTEWLDGTRGLTVSELDVFSKLAKRFKF